MLPLPSGDFRAYLFDCDGTIADSMPAHYQAWQRTLDEYGCPFDEDLFYSWGGRPTAEVVAELNDRHRLTMPVAEVDARREHLFQQMVPAIQGVPGVLAHIDDAHGRIPIAVVSGSTRESVVSSLGALGLLDRFDHLVCAGDYTRGKPDPECYLMAAGLVGVAPEHCLVFEDTVLGLQAAEAAGMRAVRVPSPRERAALS